jgi:hypothetical protein
MTHLACAGRTADPSDSFAEALQYTVTQRTARYTCVLQLEALMYTASAQEAFQLCSRMPLCTYVAYSQHDGSTHLCQGHHEVLEVGAHHHMWLNAFKKVRPHAIGNEPLVPRPHRHSDSCWACTCAGSGTICAGCTHCRMQSCWPSNTCG